MIEELQKESPTTTCILGYNSFNGDQWIPAAVKMNSKEIVLESAFLHTNEYIHNA